MYISGRERKIIEQLLSADENLTIKEIAKSLEVSPRTIHRDLESIGVLVNDHNLTLGKKAGVGIRIIGDSNDKHQLKEALFNVSHTDFTPEERQAIILSTLLETNEPIKLFTLSADLHVTDATISNDLDQLINVLSSHNLSLIRKRGFGVKIEGNEANKRAALSYLITTYFDTFDFVSLLKENIKRKSNYQFNTISNRLLGLVNPEKLLTIEKAVDSIRNDLPYELADSAYIGLVVHLALAIERLQKGDKIEFEEAYMEQIVGTVEYEMANKIIHYLEQAFDLDIPNDEIGYITMHLKGAKLRIDQNYLIEETGLDTAYQAKELIRFVEKQLDVELTGNEDLLNGLVLHLRPTIYRLKQGMNINNPLIGEITKDYQDLFQLIREGVHDIFPDLKFPLDEIGYLVLHFAAALLHGEKEVNLKALVICASGIGTAKILAMKLMQRIPEIKQVENSSLFELNNYNPDEYDIIVSTILLEGFEREYILASPILTQTEVHKIKKVIRQKRLSINPQVKKSAIQHKSVEVKSTEIIGRIESIQNYSKAVLDLLNGFQVDKIVEKHSLDKVLLLLCKNLEKKEIVKNKQEVVEALLKREHSGGLGIPNTSLALYHARTNGVFKPSFTICSLSSMLTVQGMDGNQMEMDTILLMLAPKNTPQEVVEILSYLSGLIIQNEANLNLFKNGSEEQIKQFLTEQFNTFLLEQNLF